MPIFARLFVDSEIEMEVAWATCSFLFHGLTRASGFLTYFSCISFAVAGVVVIWFSNIVGGRARRVLAVGCFCSRRYRRP